MNTKFVRHKHRLYSDRPTRLVDNITDNKKNQR